MRNFPDTISRLAAEKPDKVAISSPTSTLTYKMFEEKINQTAHALTNIGAKKVNVSSSKLATALSLPSAFLPP